MDDLILNLLRDYQIRNRLSDNAMAVHLGIASSSWSLFRRRKRHVPKSGILVGFCKLFPRRTGVLRDFFLDVAYKKDDPDFRGLISTGD